jgi:hypothetical protein
MGTQLPRVRYADPDLQDRLVELELTVDGDYVSAVLPAPHVWQLVLIEPSFSPPERSGDPL